MTKFRKIALFLILTALALPWAASALSDFKSRPVRAQAERIFAYDRAHPHVLPAHLLRSLSLAVEFYDDEGALKLIRALRPPENVNPKRI